MATNIDQFMREQLLDRRDKLEEADEQVGGSERLRLLLQEVDSALARIDTGCYGLCESCHDTIECDRLLADPLVRFCLDHLSRHEKSALEQDLQLAKRVQIGLLPKGSLDCDGWQICYHYEPAGMVSGDYCDVIDSGKNGLYFMVGDVSGKGVAASMLMAHLHAMFRTLIPVGLSLPCMLQHASRVFRESTLPNQYATLVARPRVARRPSGDMQRWTSVSTGCPRRRCAGTGSFRPSHWPVRQRGVHPDGIVSRPWAWFGDLLRRRFGSSRFVRKRVWSGSFCEN